MILRASISLLLLAVISATSLHASTGFDMPREVTEPILRTASLSQTDGSVASAGEVFAVAWVHQKRHVMVSRFEEDGTPIDSTPLVVTSLQYPSYHPGLEPTIVWTGETFLVAWLDGLTTLRARTLSLTGVLGSVSTVASGANFAKPRIAVSEQQRILVTVQDRGAEPEVIIGSILDTAGDVLSVARSLARFTNSFGFDVVAYSEGFLLLGARVDLNGTPGANGYPSSVHAVPVSFEGDPGAEQLVADARHAVFNLRAASNGTSVVAIWSSNFLRPGFIFTAYIEPEGETSSPQEVQQGLFHNQTLTSTGEGYVATIEDTYRIWSLHLDEKGRAAGPLTLLTPEGLPPLLSSSAVAADGSVMVVLETAAGLLDVFGMLLNTHGLPLSSVPFWLARSPSLQKSPAAAAADGTSLVAWVEERADQRRHVVAVAVLNASGETVQATVLGESRSDKGPAVASNGQEYAVVWFAPDSELRAILLSSSGEILQDRVISLPKAQQITLDLVWSGGAYVVGYLHRGAAPWSTSLSIIRLDRSLEPIEDAAMPVDAYFVGEVISLSNDRDRVIALFGGAPLRYALISDAGVVHSHETSFHATALDQRAGIAVWTDTKSVLWGSVTTDGITVISSVPSQNSEIATPSSAGGSNALSHTTSAGLSFLSTVAISRLGGRYILSWDEGVMTGHRTLHYLELDGAGNAASDVVTLFEANMLDTGAPELVGTITGAQLLYEAVDPADGAPEVTRIYLRKIERQRPERRRPVRRAIGAGDEKASDVIQQNWIHQLSLDSIQL